jgi:hypothetical protein
MVRVVHNIKTMGLAGIMLLIPAAHGLSAAQPAVEGFSGGANGWVGVTEYGTGTWTFTGGVARVVFAPVPLFPDIGTLSNAPGATSGSFTGNFDNAGIDVVGFSFLALNALPASSVVELEWGGGTSVYRRSFSITQTGLWYNCVASLLEEDKNQWTVSKGSLTDFATARQSVTHVAVRLARTLSVSHQFLIDDLFVAGMPGSASMTRDATGRIEWDGLLAGIGYQVQSTTNLIAAPWVAVESLTATGILHTTIITNAAKEGEAFRINFD